jgi:MraZ protein
MLLTGTHSRTLDDKNRITLPKRVREQLGDIEQLFVTPGPDQCLWVFDQANLETLSTKLDRAPAADSDVRVFRRLFFAQMEAVDLDRMGRALIPERLVRFAGLDKEVVLIGVRDHLELWNAGKWDAYLHEHGPRFDAVAEGAFQGRRED